METFLKTTVRISDIFSEDGPQNSAQNGLLKFRREVAKQAKEKGISVPELLLQIGKEGNPVSTWNLRVAVLKLLYHFSMHSKRGAQDIWVYSPPVTYRRWLYQEIQGSEKKVLAKLKMENEVFSEQDRDLMADALQIALNCSLKTLSLLSNPSANTIDVAKKWFEGENEQEIARLMDCLLSGFKKIANFCNANKLIFSDHPSDHMLVNAYNETFASTWFGGEGNLKVIYIAGNFRTEGNSGKLWLCAQAIIHEASHSELKTQDKRLDIRGLRPCNDFPPKLALINADSWGYFCIDLCGYLSDADKIKVYK